MTEKEFRDYLITNREWLEQSTGHKLTMERIEEMVRDVQEEKRTRGLTEQSKSDLQK